MSDVDHQHAIVSIAHFIVVQTVQAARNALQLRSSTDSRNEQSQREATSVAEALLEQTSIMLAALPSLLTLCSSEAADVSRHRDV